jgi:hypothetical protein
LNKNALVCNGEATLAFSLLNNVMYSMPLLVTLDFGKAFIVECDTYKQGIGAILM